MERKQYIMKDGKKWDAYELAFENRHGDVATFLSRGEMKEEEIVDGVNLTKEYWNKKKVDSRAN